MPYLNGSTLSDDMLYYCEDCRKKYSWPTSIGRKYATCAACREDKLCYSQASKYVSSQMPLGQVEEKIDPKKETLIPEYNELIPTE